MKIIEQLGEGAVAAGVKAYEAVEAELRARMPLSMRDIVAAHSTAAQQARDVFERHLEDNLNALQQDTPAPAPSEPSAFDFLQADTGGGSDAGARAGGGTGLDVDIASDFQEYRAALECELCRWRVPQDGIDVSSVVEVSDGGGVRLVKSNEAVTGRAAALVRANWDAIVSKSARVWEETYAPVSAKCSSVPPGLDSVDAYEAALGGARSAALKAMVGLEDDFGLYLALAVQRDRVASDRNKATISQKSSIQLLDGGRILGH